MDVCNEVPNKHCTDGHEEMYVDVLREHGEDVVNKLCNAGYTDRCKTVPRDIREDVPEVGNKQISHKMCEDVSDYPCSDITCKLGMETHSGNKPIKCFVKAKRRNTEIAHKDRIIPKTMNQTEVIAQAGIWNEKIFGDVMKYEAKFISGVKIKSILLQTKLPQNILARLRKLGGDLALSRLLWQGTYCSRVRMARTPLFS